MGLFDIDKNKNQSVVEDDTVSDLLLQTDEELEIAKKEEEPLPKKVADEESYYQSNIKKIENVEPYKARE